MNLLDVRGCWLTPPSPLLGMFVRMCIYFCLTWGWWWKSWNLTVASTMRSMHISLSFFGCIVNSKAVGEVWGEGQVARSKGTWLRLSSQGGQVTHSQKEMTGWRRGFVGCQSEVKASHGVEIRLPIARTGMQVTVQTSCRVSRWGQVTHAEVPSSPTATWGLHTFPVLPLCSHSACLLPTCPAEVNRDEPRTDTPEMKPPHKKSKKRQITIIF